MQYNCSNRSKPAHTHEDPMEVMVCYGYVQPCNPREMPGSMSARQYDYLIKLGATDADMIFEGKRLSMAQASHLIDNLKKGPRPVSSPVPAPTLAEPPEDPRITMLRGLIGEIPAGYFAVRPDDTVNYTFIRISKPKRGRFTGTTKFQTQHGDNYELEAALWPSGKWSFYHKSFIEDLMMLVVDFRTASITYGRVIGRCCRCGKSLTDDRSRHYGIGPECETFWPWVLEQVDAEAGYVYSR